MIVRIENQELQRSLDSVKNGGVSSKRPQYLEEQMKIHKEFIQRLERRLDKQDEELGKLKS